MKKYDQIFSAELLEKYGGLAIYDEYMNKIVTIDHENSHFVNK